MATNLQNRRIITATNAAAESFGLFPGMSVAEAQARYTSLKILNADPQGDQHDLHYLGLWCLRFSPIVALQEPDGILIDITGCEAFWKGEENLLAQITKRISRNFSCRAAIAGTIGAAWGLARFDAERNIILPSKGLRERLKALPIEALRLDSERIENLHRLGFRQIGDLYPISRASLAARFGMLLINRLQQILGEEAEALTSLHPPPSYRTHLSFPEPIGTPDDLHHAAHLLLPRLCEEMEHAAHGAKRIVFTCYRIDNDISQIEVKLAMPSISPKHLYDLLKEKMPLIEPGLGIEQITLSAPDIEILTPEQLHWHREEREEKSFSLLIDRLANRLGEKKIYRWTPKESHIPERAFIKTSPLASIALSAWKNHPQERPLRLLPHPERIEAIAPIPDDPPVQFLWRKKSYRVKAISGPERIEEEWWKSIDEPNAPQTLRDYYRVADENGHEYWLYRAGLYRNGHRPSWFLHGFFQ